jgi:hypothetical protein
MRYDLDRPPRFSAAMAKVWAASLLIFAIAFGARLVWFLISPFLWMILTVVALGAIYMVIFRGFRR